MHICELTRDKFDKKETELNRLKHPPDTWIDTDYVDEKIYGALSNHGDD